MPVERDEVSGRNTTGHEWDGIKELDTPVPWASRWALRIAILYSLGYWIFFPAWPYASDFTRGVLGYSSRATVLEKVEKAATQRDAFAADLLDGNLAELADDPAIRAKYEGSAAILARDNCAMCHGRDLGGQTGFPNLRDDHWLWSGDIEEIATTLRFGINSGHDEERSAEMLAFGAQQMLERADIRAVTDYVLSLSGQPHEGELAETGAAAFEENCVACHGDEGEGGLESGAPSLADKAWIYGGDRDAIYRTIWSGRIGVMPAWSDRLSEADIRKLALYVNWQRDE